MLPLCPHDNDFMMEIQILSQAQMELRPYEVLKGCHERYGSLRRFHYVAW